MDICRIDGIIIGTDQADSLTTGEGNQVIAAAAGDDVIDGGSGFNTYQVIGTVDAFYWAVNSSGDVKLTDTIIDVSDLVDGTDEGIDTLKNIQIIRYVAPDGTTTTQVIDDFGNMPDEVADIAISLTNEIFDGKFDPFDGKFSIGELLGMSEYLPGIDAIKP